MTLSLYVSLVFLALIYLAWTAFANLINWVLSYLPLQSALYRNAPDEDRFGVKIPQHEPLTLMASNTESFSDGAPMQWEQYVGNEPIKEIMQRAIQVAEIKGKPMKNYMFLGQGGLGKTALAKLTAYQAGVPIKITDARALSQKEGRVYQKLIDCIVELNKSPSYGILFIDEIHGLDLAAWEQILYPHLESGKIELDGRWVDTSSVTVIGSTTELAELTTPQQTRFSIVELKPYSEEELFEIVKQSLQSQGYTGQLYAIDFIAELARGNARTALKITGECIDYVIAKGITFKGDYDQRFHGIVAVHEVLKVSEQLGYNALTRLKTLEIEYLKVLSSQTQQKASIATIANVMRLAVATVKEVEAHLLRSGLVEIRGSRVLTAEGASLLRAATQYPILTVGDLEGAM